MVKLDKIYTRGGDRGETSLGDGKRLAKDATRIQAIGDIDEANSVIGVARAAIADSDLIGMLERVQNDLFDLGADIATPGNARDGDKLRITPAQVARLEDEIDGINDRLEPLTSFILPGGTEAASLLHMARSVTRRAERCVTTLARKEAINDMAVAYLNRLSDLMFVMARAANDDGRTDILWRPGMNG
jgi:cob(I)alamin adenosyltransferase